MSWKRMLGAESDSSSSDEPHEKRPKIPWKQLKFHKPSQDGQGPSSSLLKLYSNYDGQGTSSSPQEMIFFTAPDPNPSDVLLHHDYVGSRPGPSSSSHNAHTSTNDTPSMSQKQMRTYRFYTRDRSQVIDDVNEISPFVEGTSFRQFYEIANSSSYNHPKLIISGDEDEIGESLEEEERFIDNNSSIIMRLSIPGGIPNKITSRESVLKSPPQVETQEISVSVVETPSTSTEVNTAVQLQSQSPEEQKDIKRSIEEDSKISKTDTSVSTHNSQKGQCCSKRDANSNLNEVLLGLLECQVCWEVMLPPIYQCARGHLLCKVCRKRLSTCPTCRASFSMDRNLAMEKVSDKLKYPCKNSGSGCDVLVYLREKKEHEASCPHRLFTCLSPNCKPRWTCKLAQLSSHYESSHSTMLLRGPTHLLKITHDFNCKPASLDWIILAFDQLFRVNIHLVPPGDVYGCVQYIGPYNCSKKFIYELKTKLSLDTYRCISFERTTHSDLTKIERNYLKKDSFHLPDTWTKNFESCNFPRSISRLEISVTIKSA